MQIFFILMLFTGSIQAKSMSSIDVESLVEQLKALGEITKRGNRQGHNPYQDDINTKYEESGNGDNNTGYAEELGVKIEMIETQVDDPEKRPRAQAVNDIVVSKSLQKRVTILSGECPTNIHSNNPCANYGVCVSSEGGHTCLCKAGWTGADCSQDNGDSTTDPNTLFVNNGVTVWGTWSAIKRCQKSHFATGFQIRFEGDQGNGDDTGLNKLSLLCTPPDGSTGQKAYMTSGEHNWGEWKTLLTCPYNYYIVDFNQQVDLDSGGGHDDWGTANFKFTCRGPGLRGTQTKEIVGNAGGSDWGYWDNPKSSVCRPGTAVCAMQTKNVGNQGSLVWNDDVAMVDTRLWCCNFDDQPSRYLITNFIDTGKLIKQPPKVVATDTVKNEGNTSQTHRPSLSYQKSITDELTKTIDVERLVEQLQSFGEIAKNISIQDEIKHPKSRNVRNNTENTIEGVKVEIMETPLIDQEKRLRAQTVNDIVVSKIRQKRVTILSGECPTHLHTNNPCANYGVCMSSEGGHTCLCKAGWTGADCSQDNGDSTIAQNVLFVNNGVTGWGYWSAAVRCPKSHFVTGFQIKFEDDQGNGDDTGLNQLSLLCTPPDGSTGQKAYITSGVPYWGEWKTLLTCPENYYIVDFNQQVDPGSGGFKDDWGTANFKFTCRGPGLRGTQTQEILGNAGGSDWGYWGNPKSSMCRPGTAVCAMQTKNVYYQGPFAWNDNVAMVDTRLGCCNFDDQPSRYVITNFKFNIDTGKLIKQPPKVVATDNLRNEGNSNQTQSTILTYEKSVTDEWTKTKGLSVGVSTSIEVGGSASVVKGTFGGSMESSYSTSWGQAFSESFTFTSTYTVKVPARSISVVEVVLTEAIMDIPYTAELTTYFVGSTKTDVRRISGVWEGIRAVSTYGIIKPAVPIP